MPEYIIPGRIELVGKHVDYAGGRSLTCAVDLGVHVHATPLSEPVVRITSRGWDGLVEIALDSAPTRIPPAWGAYAAAVARRFARDFPHARRGVSLDMHGNLPAAAGLSSSSAVVVAVAMALADANEMDRDPGWTSMLPDDLARAEYFAAMETGAPFGPTPGDSGVGVRGGGQDHVAIVCAQSGSVSQFSYLPARLERRVPWPAAYVLVVGVSGVEATKTGNVQARYNRASDATRALVTLWNEKTHRRDATLADALASAPDAYTKIGVHAAHGIVEFSAQYLQRRLAQFREEVEDIVPGVADAIRDVDLDRLGALVDRSQQLAELALENQIPETIHLARHARVLGACASSAFGAGFGGAVWAMVRAADAERFIVSWRADYESAFPQRATQGQWLVTNPSGPARGLDLPRK